MQGLLALFMRMTEDDSLNTRMKEEVVLEVRDVYLEEREEFLKTVDPELVDSIKRDKDILFQLMAYNYINNDRFVYTKLVKGHQSTDIEILTEMMYDVVWRAQPEDVEFGWVWQMGNVSKEQEVSYEAE